MNVRRLDPLLQPLVTLALDAGAQWRASGKHYVLCLPSGRRITYARTCGGGRGVWNAVALTKRLLREEGIVR